MTLKHSGQYSYRVNNFIIAIQQPQRMLLFDKLMHIGGLNMNFTWKWTNSSISFSFTPQATNLLSFTSISWS